MIRTTFCLILSLRLSCASVAQAVTFDTTTVGNPGNAPDSTGFGAVDHAYRISRYEVTNAQYVEFLNAVATVDSSGLYFSIMTTDSRCGVVRQGTPGNYSYDVKPNFADKPVTLTAFTSVLRFANWMHNGQPTGLQGATTTEEGAYSLSLLPPIGEKRLRRNPGAKWFLPSEDEWYKAAYHQPAHQGGDGDDYWKYATRSNDLPTMASSNTTGQVLNPGVNVANYGEGADWNGMNGNVTDVGGAGPLSTSFYGTFDQTGNASEWIEGGNETALDELNVFRGGNWDQFYFESDVYDPEKDISSSLRIMAGHGSSQIGFRLATIAVPEPSTLLMAAVVGLYLFRRHNIWCL